VGRSQVSPRNPLVDGAQRLSGPLEILETSVEYGYLTNPARNVKFPQKALKEKRAIITARGASILPPWLKQALAAHRQEVNAFLNTDEDVELKPTRARHELIALGFIQLETGEFCHPQGDEKGDAILLGLIDPAVLDAENEQAAKDINAPPPRLPRAVPVNELREVYPGRWRWSEVGGQLHTDPFPKLKRIEEYLWQRDS
jgi:hypothetical protein